MEGICVFVTTTFTKRSDGLIIIVRHRKFLVPCSDKI